MNLPERESPVQQELSQLDNSVDPGKIVLATTQLENSSPELFGVAQPEPQQLVIRKKADEITLVLARRPMPAFHNLRILTLIPQSSGEIPGRALGSFDGQIKYLRSRDPITVLMAEDLTYPDETEMSLDEFEELLRSLSSKKNEHISAEVVAAVYKLKLEQQRKFIEEKVSFVATQQKAESVAKVNRVDQGDEWLWTETCGGREVVVFPNDEGLHIVYLLNNQQFLFNFEASPALGYERVIVANGGANEFGQVDGETAEKRLRKVINKELGEEHGAEIVSFKRLGKIYGAPDRLRAASDIGISVAKLVDDEGQLAEMKKGADEKTIIERSSFTADEVRWLILNNKITCARTIAAFYLAELYLKDHPLFLTDDSAD